MLCQFLIFRVENVIRSRVGSNTKLFGPVANILTTGLNRPVLTYYWFPYLLHEAGFTGRDKLYNKLTNLVDKKLLNLLSLCSALTLRKCKIY